MERRIRNLTDKEIVEIFQDWYNFKMVFGQTFYIIRDLTNKVYEVKVYDDSNIKTCIVHQTFKTLKKLAIGLNEICEKYC